MKKIPTLKVPKLSDLSFEEFERAVKSIMRQLEKEAENEYTLGMTEDSLLAFAKFISDYSQGAV